MKAAEIFSKKPFPGFITGSSIFINYPEIIKIFPQIGLENFEEIVNPNYEKQTRETAKDLIRSLSSSLKRSIKNNKNAECKKIASSLTYQLRSPSKIIKTEDTLSLKLKKDIYNEKRNRLFNKGESLFRAYKKFGNIFHVPLEDVEGFPKFKEFSRQNIKHASNKYVINFSSDGVEGAWDIATMSMRGISSCQRWGHSYSTGLIGSIIDPFVGIIYITDGKNTQYGSKMLKRSVVRFLINTKTNTPCIGVENMYPEYCEATFQAFKKVLKKKTKNKFSVVYLKKGRNHNKYRIPTNLDLNRSLNSACCSSYLDSAIPYTLDKVKFTSKRFSYLNEILENVKNQKE